MQLNQFIGDDKFKEELNDIYQNVGSLCYCLVVSFYNVGSQIIPSTIIADLSYYYKKWSSRQDELSLRKIDALLSQLDINEVMKIIITYAEQKDNGNNFLGRNPMMFS